MHLAHQELFSRLDTNGAVVVISTGYANLSPDTARAKYTHYPLFFYPLKNIKHLDGAQFINLLKEEFPNLEKIVVGYDFHFGHKAASNIEDLKQLFDGTIIIIDEYKLNDIAIHSRVIRHYLRDGDLDTANILLGYEYSITGNHIKGQGIGSEQFVPTINVNIDKYLFPKNGIYITETILGNKKFKSVSFVGHRVTTDGNFAVETHILDNEFSSIIPKSIEIKFLKRIRDNKKFDIYEDLKKEILNDINIAKNWWRENNEKC